MTLRELAAQLVRGQRMKVRVTEGARRRRTLKMTRAEQAVYEILGKGGYETVAQQVRNLFMLDGGGMYIPDFIAFAPGQPALAVEVKGGYRGPGAEQGYERYRRAALQYSGRGCFAFELWTVRGGNVESIERWEEPANAAGVRPQNG